ncbi:MFS transporter [Pseudoclavibacter sp. VKM Ac-2888]|uniref:MFS transporter n=1 Tax=Pseudoclavibacter sp. VKM Ac-2888 TaxID=2783830 RepID=UPI00188CD044|nr:MFS transporter [Pseudoclavibacter sp. VKM Ac-2888]MBF4550769.1 MFS transporter [Pseudoclavibacter sp. VKM Ac-2888]
MTSPSLRTSEAPASTGGARAPQLRLAPLIVLALMGFILVAMETMPAGLLPEIADGLKAAEGTVGLFVSAYALGTVIVTIPAISLTRRLRRKPLLLVSIAGLVAANTVTAFSSDIALSLVTRFIAGAFSGVIWGMLAPYAVRISPPSRLGAAIAIVAIGAPLGFAFGTPLGAWIGAVSDWRWSFAGLSALAALVAIAVVLVVPDAPGRPALAGLPMARVLRLRGVPVVLAVIFVWMLAHSTIYTYVAPYLRETGTAITPDLMLLAYGIASLLGVAVTGLLLDRYPSLLLHLSVLAFIVAAVVLLAGQGSPVALLAAAALWGVSFGGASPQLQNALTRAGGENSDVANSFLPVAFNLAIFGAGILGAGLLEVFDGLILPAAMMLLGAVALLLTFVGRRSAFRQRETGSGDGKA